MKKKDKKLVATKDIKVKEKKEKKGVSFPIRFKLIIAFLIPVSVFLIAGILIYNKCSSTLISNSKKAVNTTVSTISEYISSGGVSAKLIADRLNSEAVACYSGDEPTRVLMSDTKQSLINEASADYLVSDIVLFGDTNYTITSSGVVSGENFAAFSTSKAGEYLAGSDKKSNWIGKHAEFDQAISFDPEAYAISYIRQFNNKSNRFAGYIMVNIQASYINNILNNADLSEGSYTALILKDGTEIVSGDGAFSFGDKPFFQGIIDTKEAGEANVNIDGKDYMFVYSPIDSVDGVVCAVVPSSGVLAAANSIKIYLAIALIICALVATIIGNYFSVDIGKTISKVNQNLQQTSMGDLTTELHLSRKDEFSTLSFNIRNMTGSMKNLIQKMSNVSGELMGSSSTVENNTNTILDMTKAITTAVGYIDEGISQQSIDTANCLNQMEELAGRIEVVQTNANEINEITETAKAAIENGMSTVSELSTHVIETTDVTKGIINEITSLSEEAKEISGIITTIEEISEETNLLALNASIEAARAGEAGRGFSVVADNIRGFATRSTEAAGQIGEIVGNLQARMLQAITAAQKAEGIVNNQEASLKTTINVFDDIRNNVIILSGNLQDITTSMLEIEKAKNDTLSAIESISSTSTETSASASELNKTVEKQLEAVEKLNEAVSVLQQNASDLDESVSIFKI